MINSRTITPRRLFSHWEDVRQGIKKLVAPLDSEALLWQPEGSRASIDWIIRHLATAEAFWITGTIRGDAFTPLRRREFPTTAEVMVAWDDIHRRSLATLDNLTLEQLFEEKRVVAEPSPFAGQELTLHQIFWIAVDHECHHRGQIQMLLRLMGREPNDRYLF